MGFHISSDSELPESTSALQSFKEPEDWLDSFETADLLEVFTVDRYSQRGSFGFGSLELRS
jgi:hypothetical protein